MRRMWIQLSVAFGGVVILSALVLVVIANFVVQYRVEELIERMPRQIRRTMPPLPLAAFTPSPESTVLILFVVGAVLGVIVAIFMSRRLTQPLADLAAIATRFGGRDFRLRAPESGTEEVRQVARAFNGMAAALEESERLRNNLFADVAHELRTPLTVMQGNLRAILDDVYPLSKTEILRLYDQTRHLSRLVNDLHELALAEAKALRLSPEPTDVGGLIRDATDIFTPIAEAEGIHVTLDIAPDLPPFTVDPGRIKQVIHNLLVNALRHTSDGGSIRLAVRMDAGGLCIEVADTGSGIPAEHLPYVFERFYRADPARTRESGGAGLGLAICKAIIEAHGGTLRVISSTVAPSGTQFYINIPMQSPKPAL